MVILEVLGDDAVRQLVHLLLPGFQPSSIEQVTVAARSLTGGHAWDASKIVRSIRIRHMNEHRAARGSPL